MTSKVSLRDKTERRWLRLIKNISAISIRRAMHYNCRAALFGPIHKHADVFHISYVIEGKSKIMIDGRRFEVSRDDIIFIRPRQEHASLGDRRNDLELIEVKFSVENKSAENAVPAIPDVSHFDRPAAMLSCLQRTVEAHLINPTGLNYLANLRLVEAMMLLSNEARDVEMEVSASDDLTRKVRQAVTHISLNYAEPVSVESLAEMTGISASYFAMSFKKIMGVSPIEFAIRTRLHHSRELLHASTMSIKQIARICGFNSPHYFARLFTMREGVTPKAYKRRSTTEKPSR